MEHRANHISPFLPKKILDPEAQVQYDQEKYTDEIHSSESLHVTSVYESIPDNELFDTSE